MSILGSNITGDVGLRLLLCPLGSNIVIRTACCSIGTVLPVYSTFKAIERKDQNEQEKWLMYWAAYGSFSLVEVFSDKLISWFPMYYHLKFAFLVWLQLPTTEIQRMLYRQSLISLGFALTWAFVVLFLQFQLALCLGAKQLYVNYLQPFFSRYQGRFDQVLGAVYHEMVKLISAHQGEIRLVRTLIVKIMGSVGQILRGDVKSIHPDDQRAIEDPGRARPKPDTGSGPEE